jgi:hypothetical protein
MFAFDIDGRFKDADEMSAGLQRGEQDIYNAIFTRSETAD